MTVHRLERFPNVRNSTTSSATRAIGGVSPCDHRGEAARLEPDLLIRNLQPRSGARRRFGLRSRLAAYCGWGHGRTCDARSPS